jgi:hypothetical protein
MRMTNPKRRQAARSPKTWRSFDALFALDALGRFESGLYVRGPLGTAGPTLGGILDWRELCGESESGCEPRAVVFRKRELDYRNDVSVLTLHEMSTTNPKRRRAARSPKPRGIFGAVFALDGLLIFGSALYVRGARGATRPTLGHVFLRGSLDGMDAWGKVRISSRRFLRRSTRLAQ